MPRVSQPQFTGRVWYWRGPAPWFFVSLPVELSDAIAALAPQASYGWGAIPVTARIAATTFTTSIFPKDGGYILPLKASVRRAESFGEGDEVGVHLEIQANGALPLGSRHDLA